MKVQSTRRIIEKLAPIMDMRQASSIVNYIICEAVNNTTLIPRNIDSLRREAEGLVKRLENEGERSFTPDELLIIL